MLSFKHSILITLGWVLLFSTQCVKAEIIIKFSHIASSNSPKGMAATHFKELAERLTSGKVRVEIYPDGQLFSDNEELEALQLDSVQMLAPTYSKFSSLGIHCFEVLDLPFLFRTLDDLHRITEGPVGRKLLTPLDSQGIIGLGYWDNGFKSMSANKPIHAPGDMRGLRMRVQPSKVIATQMTDLGAIPFAMPFSETYRLFNSGEIDGTEATLSQFYTLNLMQSQKFLTLTNHGYLGYVVIVNKKFWEALPTEIRKQLTDAFNQSTKYASMIAQQQHITSLTAIKNSGRTTVIELNDTEKKLWDAALSPVKKQMERRIGKNLIEEIQHELAESAEP